MRTLLTIIFLLASLPAHANTVDYFCLFANAAAAQANATVGAYWHPATSDSPASWDESQTFPGIKVVTPQALVNGVSTGLGFWIIIARRNDDAALDAVTNCVMKLDRDVAITGRVPGAAVAAQAISSITNSGNTATVITALPHGLATHNTVTIEGATPADYDGSWPITVTGTTTFTFVMPTTPAGPASPVGTYSAMTQGSNAQNFVLAAAITGANRTNLLFSPVPAGSQYTQPLGQ